MPAVKTNERPGTRAVLRHSHVSAYKAREVLDLIRGVDFLRAAEILGSSERGPAEPIGKLLRSAAANAQNNEGLDPEELYVSACFADEGTTIKRWRPRARGRATRIRKRTCHITVILSRMADEEIARRRARQAAEQAERRARRVAGTRRSRRQQADTQAEVAAEVAAEQAAAEAAEAAAAAEAEAAEAEAVAAEPTEAEAVAAEPTEAEAAETEPTEAEAVATEPTEDAPAVAPEAEAAAEEAPAGESADENPDEEQK